MAIFVWYPKERGDLTMIHDENNVLTDDELVVVRDSLRNYEMNILVDFVLNKMTEEEAKKKKQ